MHLIYRGTDVVLLLLQLACLLVLVPQHKTGQILKWDTFFDTQSIISGAPSIPEAQSLKAHGDALNLLVGQSSPNFTLGVVSRMFPSFEFHQDRSKNGELWGRNFPSCTEKAHCSYNSLLLPHKT